MIALVYPTVSSAPNKKGEYNVTITIERAGRRLKIATGLKSQTYFNGREFPEEEPNGRRKTNFLNRLLLDLEDMCLANERLSNDDLLELISERVTGIKPRKKKLITIEGLLREYADGLRTRTASLYRMSADRVAEYDSEAGTDIKASWLEKFERHLLEVRGLKQNSAAIVLRNIRTVFNKARRDGVTTNYPFLGFRIREERRMEVNDISVEQLRQLRDYPVEPWQEIHRDLFMLSFYLAGVNMGDLLLCKGLTGGRFICRRQKTGMLIDLPVCEEARIIINRYKGKNYLLNVLDSYSNYLDFLGHINRALRKIGPSEIVPDKVGKRRKIEYHPILPNITTYTARYTFASIAANDLDIPEDQIGRCLGHAWTQHVTSRYISRSRRKIDETVMKVVGFVNQS